MHIDQGLRPRGVLIGDPVYKSDGSSIRDLDDDVYRKLLVNYWYKRKLTHDKEFIR
jgi:hypothetical protein